MMNRFYLPLIFTGLSMVIGSCYKDKGNYDYREINEVRIKILPDCIKYSGTDSLNLNPELTYTKNPDGDYSYEWIAVRLDAPLGSENKPVFIGKEKNLRYRIDLNTGIYSVCLSVKDETTGLVWKTRFRLNVVSGVYKGWMILCDDNGKIRLDMVEESSAEPRISKDILSRTLFPNKAMPRKIQFLTHGPGADDPEIFLLTGEGCSRLLAEDISWEEANDFPYIMANQALQNCKPECFAASNNGSVMIADGDLFWRKRQGSALFGDPINYVDGNKVKLAPYIGQKWELHSLFMGTNNYVVFDVENRQFLKYHNNANACSRIDDFPMGYDLIYMQNTNYHDGLTYAVLKKNGKYFLFSFYANELLKDNFREIEIPEFDTVSKMAFDPLYPYMFYVHGSFLNLYSWEEEPGRQIKTIAELGRDSVTLLKYNLTNNGLSYSAFTYPDRYLVLGTLNQSGEGKLSFYEPLPNMAGARFLKAYGPFPKIADATYRER